LKHPEQYGKIAIAKWAGFHFAGNRTIDDDCCSPIQLHQTAVLRNNDTKCIMPHALAVPSKEKEGMKERKKGK